MTTTTNEDRPHVGIVACSAEGAALCYRTFCVEGAKIFGRHAHPDISMHTHCLADYMVHIDSGNWEAVSGLMLSSATKLRQIGAQLLVCPDNTIHQAFELVERKSDLPWLHIARVVSGEAKQRGWTKLGVLGTRYLMEGPVYPEACGRDGIETETPEQADRVRINQIIFDELVYGEVKEESRGYFNQVIGSLEDRGCMAVVLGCTEIPLIVDPTTSPLPTLDSTRLLARAALQWTERAS